MPKHKDVSVYRGDETELSFILTGDYSAKSFNFAVKEDKEFSSPRLIDIENSDILKNYDSDSDSTTIEIPILSGLTASLSDSLFVYDLLCETDNETVYEGNFKLQLDVQTPYDNTSVGTVYKNQAFDRILICKVISDSMTEEIDLGFDVTLSFTKVSTGKYKIISDKSIFDSNCELRFTSMNKNDSNLMQVFLFTHDLGNSLTELTIGVLDQFSGMAIDTDFRFVLQRVRQ